MELDGDDEGAHHPDGKGDEGDASLGEESVAGRRQTETRVVLSGCGKQGEDGHQPARDAEAPLEVADVG